MKHNFNFSWKKYIKFGYRDVINKKNVWKFIEFM